MKNGWVQKVLPVLILLGMLTGCVAAKQTSGMTIVSEMTGIKERESGNTPFEAIVQQFEGEGQQQIADMSSTYRIILSQATKEFIAGYPVDESFLMWVNAAYGDGLIERLGEEVQKENQDVNLWYELTGNSMHVLWLYYCQECGFERYRLSNVYWKECQSDEEAVLSFIGDINFDENWYTMQKMQEQENGIYGCISEELMGTLTDSDVMVVNHEFAYTQGGTPLAGKTYTFGANPQRVELLEAMGTDLASLGNNHVYDYGEEGLLSTLDTLRYAGIPYVGAGENLEEAEKIVYFVLNGKKIAIVSATQIERTTNFTKEATENSPGVLKMLHPEKYLSVIEQADQTSDYVIAIAHWGTEGKIYFDQEEIDYATRLVNAGADAVIGGHPHRLQGSSFINGVPVAYSLGNFWFSTGSLYTTVAQVVIGKDGELRLRYQPCVQSNLTTSLLTDEKEKEDFFDYLTAISYDIGIDAEGFVYDRTGDIASETSFCYVSGNNRYQNANLSGLYDNDGNVIDIVGNLK